MTLIDVWGFLVKSSWKFSTFDGTAYNRQLILLSRLHTTLELQISMAMLTEQDLEP